jgi:hypothetical protein
MRTAQPDKRTRLIETATKLAYGRGFRETSLADIAQAARVPVGNVYDSIQNQVRTLRTLSSVCCYLQITQ